MEHKQPKAIEDPQGVVDPSADEAEEPDDVPDPDLEDPDETESRFPLDPRMVNALILIAVLVFIGVNVAAWQWVVHTSEADEKGDWAQLRSIKGSMTGFAMFLLGGFLGFQAQRGATEKAKGKARKNRDAAKEQHKVAKHRSKVAHERGERLRVIHGKTIETLKHQQRRDRPLGQLIAGTERLELVENRELDLRKLDTGRVTLEGSDPQLQEQLLEIAELASGD